LVPKACPTLLGLKGGREGGTVAATPTVMTAILDALAPLGIADLPMPATPERICARCGSALGANQRTDEALILSSRRAGRGYGRPGTTL